MADTARVLMEHVTAALDQLVETGDRYQGLFPSMIDRRTQLMLLDIPPAIPGQRIHDRSNNGSNLTHDEPALMTMYALGKHAPRFTLAADRYIKRFATHCTNTPTGLFPWGEHSCWNLVDDAVGNVYRSSGSRDVDTTHDHLRATPLWLWQKLGAFNPACVERFAQGLRCHWLPPDEGYPLEYSRHAYLEHHGPYQGGHIEYSPDFPRHGGFYVFDWAYAYSLSHNADHLAQIRLMLDYHWKRRNGDNLLYIESRARPMSKGSLAVAQTLSFASSLIEAAAILETDEPTLAGELREHAAAYIEGFFTVPTDLKAGVFYNLWNPREPEKSRIAVTWGSTYGKTPVCYGAGNVLCTWRLTGDERLLAHAKAAGQGYLNTPFPQEAHVPAMDAGMGLGLLADLYAVTGDGQWLDGALKLGSTLAGIYFEQGVELPRGASGIDWYESQMGPGFLLHGMARTAMLAQDRATCPLAADDSGR